MNREVLNADCAAIADDLPDDVTFDAYTTKGAFDAQGVKIDVSGLPQVQADNPTLLFRTAALPGLKVNSLIAVNGVQYRVRSSDPLEDGLMSQAALARV